VGVSAGQSKTSCSPTSSACSPRLGGLLAVRPIATRWPLDEWRTKKKILLTDVQNNFTMIEEKTHPNEVTRPRRLATTCRLEGPNTLARHAKHGEVIRFLAQAQVTKNGAHSGTAARRKRG
jgi:hypothetical protein